MELIYRMHLHVAAQLQDKAREKQRRIGTVERVVRRPNKAQMRYLHTQQLSSQHRSGAAIMNEAKHYEV